MDPSISCHDQLKQLLLSVPADELRLDGLSEIDRLQQAFKAFQLDSKPVAGEFSVPNEAASLITLKKLPGRGIGVVATRRIPAGSIIFKEKAVLTLPVREDGAVYSDFFTKLVGDYNKLPPGTRQRILGLHAYTRPDLESAVRKFLAAGKGDAKLTKRQVDFLIHLNSICATNSFGGAKLSSTMLYLGTSRINHSCIPNCEHSHGSENNFDYVTVYAIRNIHPDEEITVTYLDVYDPRDKRRADMERVWGFVCNCPACDYANPLIDTTIHESRIADYRRLRLESCLTISMDVRCLPLPLEDLDEALRRSIRRAVITESISDNQSALEEYILSAGICDSKWFLTGDERDIKTQISFLEPALALTKKFPYTHTGRETNSDVGLKLQSARARLGSTGRAQWAQLRKYGVLVPRGDKLVAAQIALGAKLSDGKHAMDFIDGRIPLKDLPAELRALVTASGHSLEEILKVAREELTRAQVEGDV
ncbi:hypothetical protein N8I77_000128 [Diaporthe amygdali]|uniref:SET domain-containing protein n=1 Tax=Phomopsis amygdali TaxID=1214568 RepID=A0AAD9W8S1_PHOAM|nr:hypothetical protein N8I77_000128 [Diaporthe amygdali]